MLEEMEKSPGLEQILFQCLHFWASLTIFCFPTGIQLNYNIQSQIVSSALVPGSVAGSGQRSDRLTLTVPAGKP